MELTFTGGKIYGSEKTKQIIVVLCIRSDDRADPSQCTGDSEDFREKCHRDDV